MALGEVYELVIHQTLYGITVNNVFHFRDYTGAGAYDDLPADFVANAMAQWRAMLSTDVLVQSVATRMIYPFTNFGSGAGVNLNGSYGFAGAAPPVVTGVVTWLTGSVGRRYRGRTYISGMNKANLSGSGWDPTMQTLMFNFGLRIMNIYGPAGTSPKYRYGVWSRKNGVINPTTTDPAGFTACTGFTVRAYACAMGTRRAGHGT